MDTTSVPPRHPEELLALDRPYIVAWGRREVAVVLGLTAILSAGILCLSLAVSPVWAILLVPLGGGAALLVLFFRNPRRRIPSAAGLLVSPADGTVWDIARVEEKEFVRGPCVRIGIFLSIFSVHVNRAPASGRVEWVSHRDGKYHDARSEAAGRENESNLIGMVRADEGGPQGTRLLVRQVSGAIARRIICPLNPPVSVERGGLLGMIKYGSRTELYIPEDCGARVLVRVGDKVKAGATVLAAWPQ